MSSSESSENRAAFVPAGTVDLVQLGVGVGDGVVDVELAGRDAVGDRRDTDEPGDGEVERCR